MVVDAEHPPPWWTFSNSFLNNIIKRVPIPSIMDAKTKADTLRWIRQVRRDAINNTVMLIDQLDTLEELLNE